MFFFFFFFFFFVKNKKTFYGNSLLYAIYNNGSHAILWLFKKENWYWQFVKITSGIIGHDMTWYDSSSVITVND